MLEILLNCYKEKCDKVEIKETNFKMRQRIISFIVFMVFLILFISSVFWGTFYIISSFSLVFIYSFIFIRINNSLDNYSSMNNFENYHKKYIYTLEQIISEKRINILWIKQEIDKRNKKLPIEIILSILSIIIGVIGGIVSFFKDTNSFNEIKTNKDVFALIFIIILFFIGIASIIYFVYSLYCFSIDKSTKDLYLNRMSEACDFLLKHNYKSGSKFTH